MSYLDELDRELGACGLSLRRRRRIVAEFADHLRSDPGADLGEPAQIARQFAEELGSAFARTAALQAFLALSVTGVAVFGVFVAGGRMRNFAPAGHPGHPLATWAALPMLVAAVAAQVALACGCLALLRAWHLRGRRVIGGRESEILVRRSIVGLGAGAVTVVSLLAAVLSAPHPISSAVVSAAWVAAGVALVSLAFAAPAALAGARIQRPRTDSAGDLRDDLGALLPASATPLTLALILATIIAVLLTVTGVLANDPYDGAARGIADAAACLIGYAILGRYLGLRPASGVRPAQSS